MKESEDEQIEYKENLVIIKNVLMPTDFSELSNKAIETALPMVKKLEARVIFLHVMERIDHPTDMAALFDEGYGQLEDRALILLNNLIVVAKQQGVQATSELKDGVPYIEILETAKKMKADLIIMGTHGRGGLSHMIIGSQAEKVVRMAPCPVTTIRVQIPDTKSDLTRLSPSKTPSIQSPDSRG